MKRVALSWLVATAFVLSAIAGTACAGVTAGKDYSVIDPALQRDDPAKIEVIEFFSYGCPHCSDLNPALMKWAGSLPADVTLKRVPVSFNPFYQLMAKLYYTLDAIGELPRLDAAVFDAIHNKGLRLVDEKSIRDWVAAQGVDAKKFSDAFSSFGVDSRVKQANSLAQAAGIPGVPALVVDGRYVLQPRKFDELLILTSELVDKVRNESPSKANAAATKPRGQKKK